MITTKEIKSLPLPTVTKQITLLASQKSLDESKRAHVVFTAQKIKSLICLNVFGKIDNQVKLTYRFFFNKKECSLYNLRTGKVTHSYLRNALVNDFGYSHDYVISEKDMEKLSRWVNYPECKNCSSLISLIESRISYSRKLMNIEKKRKELALIMKPVRKTIPKSFEKTIEKTMNFSRYLFFNKENKSVTCSHCGVVMSYDSLPKFKERDMGKCSNCKTKAKYISIKRKGHIHDKGMALLMQSYGYHKLVERYFHITYDYSLSTSPSINYSEVMRSIIDFDKHTVDEYEWYYLKSSSVKSWCPPQRSIFCPSGYHYEYDMGCMHKNGLAREIRKAGLENRFIGKEKVEQIAYNGADHIICYKHARFYEMIAILPFTERLVKCGLYNLVSAFYNNNYSYYNRDAINQEATSLMGNLKLKNKLQLKECVKADVTLEQLKLIQIHNNSTSIYRSVPEILSLGPKYKGRESVAFTLASSVLRKVDKYLTTITDKCYENGRYNLVTDYFDYISNCKILDYNMNSELVLFPKHFKKAHDDAATNAASRKLEKEYARIAELLPKMHELYDFENDKYLIMAPNSGKDITYEGQAMNHCVGTYVGKVASGSCVILFVRRKDKPNKPYVTVEVSNNKVVQVRAFGNASPSDEVKEFMKEFKAAKHVA